MDSDVSVCSDLCWHLKRHLALASCSEGAVDRCKKVSAGDAEEQEVEELAALAASWRNPVLWLDGFFCRRASSKLQGSV